MQIREKMKTYKEEYSRNSKEILHFVQNWGKRKLVNFHQILVLSLLYGCEYHSQIPLYKHILH